MAQVQVQAQAQPPVSAANGGASNGGGNQFVSTSLYVGDLESNVTDSHLYDLFGQLGPVVSVRVCRDLSTRRSLGYGYVNYGNTQDAARALDMLNFTPLNGKPIRIMYSFRDPSIRRSGTANIFIKNLDKAIDNKALYDTFSTFGAILSCKIATDASGQSKGYGFVQFDNEESAKNATDKLNGMLLNDKQVYVGPFVRKQERESATNKTKFNNVYVKNLLESTTDEDLKNIFGEYGPITSAVVMQDGDGKSKCFGFVNFENADDAARSVEALNGKKFDDKEWYVGKAQKKTEREVELKGRFEQSLKEAVDKFQGLNLYVKNLDDSIADDKLRELFSEFGTITSCKVMRDPNGISRGSGFVAFSTAEEASRALADMNGKMVASKPLYVALAQRKEDRRARLQAQFSQMRPAAMAPSVGPRMSMYPPGAPAGSAKSAARRSSFWNRASATNPATTTTNAAADATQGRVYRYPPGRNMADVPIPGVPGGMLSAPYDMAGMPFRDAAVSQPMPIGALATALANAPPDQQRTLLGENLYPLVDQLEHEMAAKVTGMLLEMDQTEVLHLLESPEALKAKVAEAMEVLRNVAQQQANNPTDRMASLSLNDTLTS
ncbi:Polyadenylate-binding protein 2 [Vitis vinifera]|uniref:Polyadenylate-binding protein n=1 Tax=Vitis vinifera TaxID=29760 RepID=A0A438FM01_VITVI|nr:Polyadenylate-binding protein 2 [Vitis vinifera]